jgi:hypothetical protein
MELRWRLLLLPVPTLTMDSQINSQATVALELSNGEPEEDIF